MIAVKSKPCPFCGSSIPVVLTSNEYDGFRIVCRKCFTLTDWFETEEEALAAWNTRAELGSERIAELEAENERLRKAGYENGYHDAMKVVYENGKSICMEICAPDKDEFYRQLLTTFEDAICKYNPDDWGEVDIKYIEVK